MSIAAITGALLGLAVLVGWLRLGSWWWAAPPGHRSRSWRVVLLALGQAVSALLLFATLFPPAIPIQQAATLTIATRGTPRVALLAPGGDLVALPEAAAPGGTPTAPDLATALRRRPGVTRVRILGEGLEPRDRDAARGLAIAFDPPPSRYGLIALALPAPVAPGAAFRVGGETAGLRGTAELIDPGGARLATAPLDDDGRFVLSGATKASGPALFRVRLRDAHGAVAQEVPIPVVAVADPAARVLFLAGAPGPEVKYWRRWAVDAGIAATVPQTIGAGLALGDPLPPLNAATLARYDLVIVDDRSWIALSPAQRSALSAAVRDGLGLLLRATGALPAEVRSGWSAFGIPLTDGAATVSVQPGESGAPALTRRVLPLTAPALVPALRGADDAVLTAWRAVGRGRVGVWSVTDDFGLVTAGHGNLFGSWWGDTVGVLARGRAEFLPDIKTLPQQRQRVAICVGAGAGEILDPDRRLTTLISDASARGCTAFWPRTEGWHILRSRGASFPFYVYEEAALPGLRAEGRRAATLALTGDSNSRSDARASSKSSSWFWGAAFLFFAGLCWWLERRPVGRAGFVLRSASVV